MSSLAGHITSIEVDEKLAAQARQNIDREGIPNVSIHMGDAAAIVQTLKSFDAIVITVGIKNITQEIFDLLPEGGRVVAPIGNDPDNLTLTVGTKRANVLEVVEGEKVSFVPFISDDSRIGWTLEEYAQIEGSKRNL